MRPAMTPETRDALLAAIAKARGWIDESVPVAIDPRGSDLR
jgi:hypothetical protein